MYVTLVHGFVMSVFDSTPAGFGSRGDTFARA
jgi:hypothetical protein